MKRKSWIVMMILVAGPLCAGTLTVIKPNGGESWTLGQANCQIGWSAAGVSQNVRINLLKGGAVVGTIAAGLPPGSSPFLWTAGKLADGTTVQAGSDYKVRVRAIDSSEVDESDGLFSLVNPAPPPSPPPPALQLKKPNGGSALLLHHETEIAWKSSAPAAVGKVRLQLMKEGCCTIGILEENLPSTGTFAWKAGEYPGNTAPTGKYRIRVSSMADPKIYDESDAAFELKSLTALASKAEQMKFLQGETVPGAYESHPCHDTFPGKITPPIQISVLQQGWQQMFGSGLSHYAWVGVYWFPYQGIQVASIYRSRILFSLSQFADKAGALKSAKLKMKRVHSVHEDANSGCGCTENLWVLEAPMTSCAIPAIGQRIDVSLATAEFTRDVTEIVRQWLNGGMANHGLLLLAGESPCSGGRKCASCYEASLILDFK